MTPEMAPIAVSQPLAQASISKPLDASLGRPRLWPALVLLAVYWSAHFVVAAIDKPYFYGFLYSMAAPAFLLILFSTWWWTNRRIPLANRLYGCVVVILTGAAVVPLCDSSLWFGLPTDGLPRALTILTLWTLLVSWTGFAWNRLGLLLVLALSWGWYALIRIDGLNAELRPTINWRWVATPEDRFLAERAQTPETQTDAESAALPALTLAAGDWPGFRGADRNGVIRGVTLTTDWDAKPPRELWRRRVGPGWSSVIVIGGRLYTQEQRGMDETVVCYDTASGNELWVHADPSRFQETVAGAGPRHADVRRRAHLHDGRAWDRQLPGRAHGQAVLVARCDGRWPRADADVGFLRIAVGGGRQGDRVRGRRGSAQPARLPHADRRPRVGRRGRPRQLCVAAAGDHRRPAPVPHHARGRSDCRRSGRWRGAVARRYRDARRAADAPGASHRRI